MTITFDIVLAVRAVRMAIAMADGRGELYPEEPLRRRLHVELRQTFPQSEDRAERHKIVMALLGRPISSQAEITSIETSILVDALKTDDTSPYFTAELHRQFEDALESVPIQEADEFLEYLEAEAVMPNL